MDWKDIEISEITVNLKRQEVSVNNDFVVMKPAKNTDRHMLMAYFVAYATKNPPMVEAFEGLTWNWLSKICEENQFAGLGRATTFRQTYAHCLIPETWWVVGKVDLEEYSPWLDKGGDFLKKLFISKYLSDSEKYVLHIPRCPKRMYFPNDVEINLVPNAPDVTKLVAVVGSWWKERIDQSSKAYKDRKFPYSTANLSNRDLHEAGPLAPTDTGATCIEEVFGQAQRCPEVGNPPHLPEPFVGRDEDVLQLKAQLGVRQEGENPADRTKVLIVQGWPGIGKSAVAAALAWDHDIATVFHNGVLWISVGQDADLLAEFYNLGRVLEYEPLQLAATIEDASRRLADAIRNKQVLVILDDVWKVEHGKVFQVGGPCSSLLLTTRIPDVATSLAARPSDVYELGELNEQASLELLGYLAPEVVRDNTDACKGLIEELGYLPLALRVAGRLLHSEFKHGWGASELLNELKEDAKRLLDEDAPSDMMELSTQTIPSVAALLRKSVDRLPSKMREHFACLGAFAPKPAKFDLGAIAAAWDLKDPKPIVRFLVGRGLLEPVGNGVFYMHALLATLARSILQE